MIAAGRLTERVRLESPPTEEDDFGGQEGAWTALAPDRRAEVVPISGEANTETEALTGLSSYRVTLRFAPDQEAVDATWRLIWNGQTLRVTSAVHDRLRQESVLICDAGAGVVTGLF